MGDVRMMHCHVCVKDVPLTEIVNHVRLLHPDAYPIAERVEVHVGEVQIDGRELAKLIQRDLWRRPPGRTA